MWLLKLVILLLMSLPPALGMVARAHAFRPSITNPNAENRLPIAALAQPMGFSFSDSVPSVSLPALPQSLFKFSITTSRTALKHRPLDHFSDVTTLRIGFPALITPATEMRLSRFEPIITR